MDQRRSVEPIDAAGATVALILAASFALHLGTGWEPDAPLAKTVSAAFALAIIVYFALLGLQAVRK